eukprot:1713402-Pleurochrysis_carterae.AAC.1
MGEVERLAESVLALDLELGPVVKLLGGQPLERPGGDGRGHVRRGSGRGEMGRRERADSAGGHPRRAGPSCGASEGGA